MEDIVFLIMYVLMEVNKEEILTQKGLVSAKICVILDLYLIFNPFKSFRISTNVPFMLHQKINVTIAIRSASCVKSSTKLPFCGEIIAVRLGQNLQLGLVLTYSPFTRSPASAWPLECTRLPILWRVCTRTLFQKGHLRTARGAFDVEFSESPFSTTVCLSTERQRFLNK